MAATDPEVSRFLADCRLRRHGWARFQKGARRAALRMLSATTEETPMTEADQIRARLDALAAQEATDPSPMWAPVEYDDEPDWCPECGSTTFNRVEDFTDYHGCRLGMGFIWRCTECKWAVRAV